MGLPAISGYHWQAQPDAASAVDWNIDPRRAALLVHDMQQYFLDAFDRRDPQAQVNAAVENIGALRQAADAAGIPVVYTAQPPNQNPADRALLTDFWGTGLVADGRERIIDALAPREGEHVLTKWRYSAFARTELDQLLKAWGRDQLLITGVYAHIGCLTTALDAFMRDVQPFLIEDALADFSLEEHQRAMDYARGRCAVVVDTSSALAEIRLPVAAVR